MYQTEDSLLQTSIQFKPCKIKPSIDNRSVIFCSFSARKAQRIKNRLWLNINQFSLYSVRGLNHTNQIFHKRLLSTKLLTIFAQVMNIKQSHPDWSILGIKYFQHREEHCLKRITFNSLKSFFHMEENCRKNKPIVLWCTCLVNICTVGASAAHKTQNYIGVVFVLV